MNRKTFTILRKVILTNGLLIMFASSSFAESSKAITCGDSFKVSGDAKKALHIYSQERGQKDAEALIKKPLIVPFLKNAWSLAAVCSDNCAEHAHGSVLQMADIIEVYWCESETSALHDAYFNFYVRNIDVFDKKYLK